MPKNLTPLDLPAPLTESECAEYREKRLFDAYSFSVDYNDSTITGLPESKDPKELLERHFDASNHALLRRLTQNTTVSLRKIGDCITTSWMRENKNEFLHNQLVVTEALHNHGTDLEMLTFIKIMLGINQNPLPRNKVIRIATVEELEGIVAVYRFIQGVGWESHNCGNYRGRTTFIWNKHLDRMLRDDPSLVDVVIPFFRERVLGGTKKDLVPLNEYLNSGTTPALVNGWV